MARLTRRSLPAETQALARLLIGKRLVFRTGAGRVSGRIVETEAYPPGDPTGYARPGLTTSNAPLFAARGPGRLCAAFGMTRASSGLDLCAGGPLWLERMPTPAIVQISTRIGLSRDMHRRLRFCERGSPFLSVPP